MTDTDAQTAEKRSTQTVAVPPARLATGSWVQGQVIDKGDIAAAYSADTISQTGTVRAPFRWKGHLWVTVMMMTGAKTVAKAYRLTLPSLFDGTPQSYDSRRTGGADEARSAATGYYHGMLIRHQGREHVLLGPPVCFEADPGMQPSVQQSLF